MWNIVMKSKKFTKIMALIMMFVIVFVFVPDVAAASADTEAADLTEPSVKVLGATLRLDKESDNSASGQAMRIGIQVNNASKAKSCAITLSVKDKKYTVSTEPEGTELSEGLTVDKQHNALYSKDIDKDTVTYAVVLYNIPSGDFDTEIGITGWVRDMQSVVHSSDDDTTEETRKTVNGVVDALKRNYPALNIHMGEDGILYRNDNKGLTVDDLDNYNSNIMEPYEVDLKKAVFDQGSGAELDSDGNIVFGPDATKYVYIPLPKTVNIGESIVINIKGNVEDGFNSFRYWPSNTETDAKDRRMADVGSFGSENTGTFHISQEMTIYDADNAGVNKATAICIKGPDGWNGAHNLKITSISVVYQCRLDLSAASFDKADNTCIDDDGNIVFANDASGYVYIPLPKAVDISESINIYIKGSVEDGFGGFRYWLSNTETDIKDRRMTDIGSFGSENTDTFNISQKMTIYDADNAGVNKATAVCIKGPNGGTGARNLKITSISVVYQRELDLSAASFDKSENTCIDDDGSIVFANDASGYVYIPLPKAVDIGESVNIYIKGSVEDGFEGFRYWLSNTETDAKDRRMTDIGSFGSENTGIFHISQEMTIYDADNAGINKATAICIKGPNGWTGAHNLKINSISINF